MLLYSLSGIEIDSMLMFMAALVFMDLWEYNVPPADWIQSCHLKSEMRIAICLIILCIQAIAFLLVLPIAHVLEIAPFVKYLYWSVITMPRPRCR